jgi:hypothetical protein
MRWLNGVRLPAALALALLAAAAFEARASDIKIRSFRYQPSPEPPLGNGARVMGPGGATRLRIILDQTGPTALTSAIRAMSGGAFTCSVLVNAPGCIPPSSIVIQAQQPADDDSATVNWPTACVVPGDCVTVKLTTLKGPIAIHRSYFGSAVQDSIAPTANCSLPGASPGGVGILAALIVLAGAWVVVRGRRPPAPA